MATTQRLARGSTTEVLAPRLRCDTDASEPRRPTPEELANTEPFILIGDPSYGWRFRLGVLLIALALVAVLASVAFAGP